ncbi:carboxypeptidase-like regulatory domain-containing protein, partial [Marinilabilia sp.]
MVHQAVHITSFFKKALFFKILLLLGLYCASPAETYAQSSLLEKKVSFAWDSIPISGFLDSLSTKYQFAFSYDASVVPGDSIIYAVGDSVALGAWLKQMLKSEELDIHQLENQVIISEEPAKIAPDAIQIRGEVIDSLDRSPMSMVNIGVMGKTIGTATNREGQFSLFLPRSYAGGKLVFSSLGYLREQVEIPSRHTTVQVELRET